MDQFLRMDYRNGRFACSSCMSEKDEKHIDLWSWGRELCFDCAVTIGGKLENLGKLGKANGELPASKVTKDLWDAAIM